VEVLPVKLTRQTIYVQRKIAARSRNHCYRVNAISITYYERVFVASGIHYAMRMRRIFICGLSDSSDIFPHYLTNCTIFDKKILLNINIVFQFSLQIYLKSFSF